MKPSDFSRFKKFQLAVKYFSDTRPSGVWVYYRVSSSRDLYKVMAWFRNEPHFLMAILYEVTGSNGNYTRGRKVFSFTRFGNTVH